MQLDLILQAAVRGGASDIILKVGALPRFRHNGALVSLSDGNPVTPEVMGTWVTQILPTRLSHALKEDGSVDFAYHLQSGASRFRVNIFRQQGHLAIVMRVIATSVRSLEELHLPKVIRKSTEYKRGLVLVTGATGSGKSTTLAGIIQSINLSRAAHIITIEDPVEFSYQEEKATISQREIGEDTRDFSTALKDALRQSPDIILVGELRDHETMETALMAAETGHLVFSTLHTKDAVDSLTRIMSWFPPHQHQSVRMQLAHSLKMVVSQRLVPRSDEKGRTAATEVLVVNSFVKEMILNGENFEALPEAIKRGGKSYGMQSFDQSLLNMYRNGLISKDKALSEASSRENMKLQISGIE